MSLTSPDAKAVVRALDDLTTQVRRIADAQSTTADDAATTPVVSVHGARDMSPEAREALGALVDVAVRQASEAPAADEDAQRTTRRASLRNLLARATRGPLSTDECAMLWRHVEAEQREADTARAVAAGNKRHVQTIVPEIDRLARELEAANSRAEAASRVGTRYMVAADQAEELLRIAHETSNRSEAARAEAQRDRDQHAAVLAEVLGIFDKVTDHGVVKGWHFAGVVDPEDFERWRSVVAPTVERPWWQQLDDAQAAIERVRELAADAKRRYRHGRNDYEIGKHDLASTVLGALDGTEQPTTEQPSTCTATIAREDDPDNPGRCVAPAGHYDEQHEPTFTGPDRSPGGWHTDGKGHAWTDRSALATPHREQPTTEA